MKRIISLALVVALLLCLFSGCGSTPETLKVMSFNIQTEQGADLPFSQRTVMFTDILKQYQPDSIGMQEVTPRWLTRLGEVFGENYAGVSAPTETSDNDACSIFYRTDKFDLVDQGVLWLSDTPDVAGSKFPESNYVRICTWARLKNKNTGNEYVHFNTHLDHNGHNTGDEAMQLRTAQGKVILEFAQSLGDIPLVFTGDLNQGHTDDNDEPRELYKYLTGLAGYVSESGIEVKGAFADARLEAPDTVSPEEWASMGKYHTEGERYDPARKPLDFIFYTAADFDALVYRNINYRVDDYWYMSDHLPQYCELTFK